MRSTDVWLKRRSYSWEISSIFRIPSSLGWARDYQELGALLLQFARWVQPLA